MILKWTQIFNLFFFAISFSTPNLRPIWKMQPMTMAIHCLNTMMNLIKVPTKNRAVTVSNWVLQRHSSNCPTTRKRWEPVNQWRLSVKSKIWNVSNDEKTHHFEFDSIFIHFLFRFICRFSSHKCNFMVQGWSKGNAKESIHKQSTSGTRRSICCQWKGSFVDH